MNQPVFKLSRASLPRPRRTLMSFIRRLFGLPEPGVAGIHYHGQPQYYAPLPAILCDDVVVWPGLEDIPRRAVAGDLGVSEDMYRDPWAEED
jgi:hypothetical protein